MTISIIYEDNDIIAVNKPAGIVTHRVNLKSQTLPTGRQVSELKTKEKEIFLTDLLLEKFPEIKSVGDEPDFRPGIVHRLDKDTSGVLIVAKNQKAFEYLKSLFQSRQAVKKYIALVEGKLKNDKGVIDLPIGRSASDFRKKLASEKAEGVLRDAVTEYKVLEKLDGYTLVEAYPKTGRTHQIRVHFKAMGNPVACDHLYGGRKMVCPDGLARHFLHANFLEFNLPSGPRVKLKPICPKIWKMF